MTVSELLDRIDVSELVEWMAYARLQSDPRAFNSTEDNLKDALRSICGKR